MNSIQQLRAKQDEEYEYAKAVLQSRCAHTNVLHDTGFRSFRTYNPERICVECGLIEVGGWWCYTVDCSHWHDNEISTKKILASKEGRIITEVSADDFDKARVR